MDKRTHRSVSSSSASGWYFLCLAVAVVVCVFGVTYWMSAERRADNSRTSERESAGTVPAAATHHHRASSEITRAASEPMSGAIVLIKVEDELGRPVADAQVGLLSSEGEFARAHPIGNGLYRLSAVPPGQYRAASAAGDIADEVSVVIDERARQVETLLVLRGSSEIHVTAQRSDGSLIGGLHVYVIPEGSSPDEEVTIGSAQGSGQYRVAPLAPGVYRVHIGDGHNPPSELNVTLAAGEVRSLNVVRENSGRISGRLVDRANVAVPRAVVRAVHASVLAGDLTDATQGPGIGRAMTDEQGYFEISGLAQGAVYRVMALVDSDLVADRSDVSAGAHVEMVAESAR